MVISRIYDIGSTVFMRALMHTLLLNPSSAICLLAAEHVGVVNVSFPEAKLLLPPTIKGHLDEMLPIFVAAYSTLRVL